jgi:hypothetical protein
MCVRVCLQLLSETFLILRKVHRDFVIDLRRSCKIPVVIVRFE